MGSAAVFSWCVGSVAVFPGVGSVAVFSGVGCCCVLWCVGVCCCVLLVWFCQSVADPGFQHGGSTGDLFEGHLSDNSSSSRGFACTSISVRLIHLLTEAAISMQVNTLFSWRRSCVIM